MRDRTLSFMAGPRRIESTVQQEIAGVGDDDLLDFMNLTSQRTGITGIVFISTKMGQHGPRVKYFEKTGKGQPSFSVSIVEVPRVLATSLPERVVDQMAPAVCEWVRLNHDALLDFWNDGQFWTDDRVDKFKVALKKIPTA